MQPPSIRCAEQQHESGCYFIRRESTCGPNWATFVPPSLRRRVRYESNIWSCLTNSIGRDERRAAIVGQATELRGADLCRFPSLPRAVTHGEIRIGSSARSARAGEQYAARNHRHCWRTPDADDIFHVCTHVMIRMTERSAPPIADG